MLFKYKKANNKYWDRPKLDQQVVNMALSIAEALYPGYSLLFLFDNTISYLIYSQNLLCTMQMNKEVDNK